MRRAVVLVAVAAGALAGAAHSGKPGPPRSYKAITLGYYSEQSGPSRAAVGARIAVKDNRPGRAAAAAVRSRLEQLAGRDGGTWSSKDTRARLPNPYPGLRSDSPLLRDPAPLGPGSFWYPDGQGRPCLYLPNSVLPCFTVVAPPGAAAPGVPAISPTAIAASVAERLALSPGAIRTSPRANGLTGAASWFWLEPTPRALSLSVSLGGEQVSVTAEPENVEWRFGDGSTLAGGAGISYRPGRPTAEAVTHIYGTRCLRGDQGRNPYVLESCGTGGYSVEAVVRWRLRYTASGPVASSGGLPTRTTETSAAYPVSEARAFLLGRGSQ